MNQIINMIIRQVTRQLINRGVKAGFDKAGEMSQRRQQQNLPADALDDHGNPVQPEMTRAERQARRQARQNAKAAKQGMKAVRRVSKF